MPPDATLVLVRKPYQPCAGTAYRTAYAKHYRAIHPELVKEQQAKWRRANQVWHQFAQSVRVHGLTLDEYAAIDERQDWLCAICKLEKPLFIDHCHAKGHVRGLLCRGCNSVLGFSLEQPETLRQAAMWLEAQQGKQA